MPAIGISPRDYLARLTTLVPGASHLTSPRYMGHMTAPLPAFTAELSRLLVMLNQNPMKMESSRLLSFLEREVLAKLHRLVYREDDAFYAAQMHAKDAALGVMTSGGTIANVTALWLALQPGLWRQPVRPRRAGLSRRRHSGLAADALLLRQGDGSAGTRGSQRLASRHRRHNRLSLAALEQALQQCREQKLKVLALVGVAGSTDFGSVDPLPELAAIARREQIHFHVDAAWGGPTLFSPRYQGLLTGIEHADTVTLTVTSSCWSCSVPACCSAANRT